MKTFNKKTLREHLKMYVRERINMYVEANKIIFENIKRIIMIVFDNGCVS
jgi:hypothetical protein